MAVMSTLLRPSTRQATRLAALSLRVAPRSMSCVAYGPRLPLRAASSSSSLRPIWSRLYSTGPPKPPAGNGENEETKREAQGPPGKEELPANEMEPEKKEPLPEGWVYLDKTDMEGLERILKFGPTSMRDDMKDVLDGVAKYGAPAELKDLLAKSRRSGLTLGDSMKTIRIAYKISERLAQKEAELRSGDKSASESAEPDESRQDAGQAGHEQQRPQATGEQQQGQQENKPGQQGQQPRVYDVSDLATWILAALLIYPFYNMFIAGENSREITWQELRKNFLDKGLVEKLIVSQTRVRVNLNREATAAVYPDSIAANPNFHYYFSIGSVDAFEKRLEEAQNELAIPPSDRIPVSYVTEGLMKSLFVSLAPTVFFIGLLYFLNRRTFGGSGSSSGVFGFSKSKAKRFQQDLTVKVRFADVAGMDEAKLEVMEFVSFLKTPERFQRLGAKIPRGAILAGPPGTGKTLLAKATAGESGVPFFSVSGSEFVEMFVGVGASRVRDLFATARKTAPCIIFIDEIDAIGKSRGDGPRGFGGNDEREATLNQILTEMDGFNTTEQVVVLAGTNRPDILDKALTRPGRFDRHINIDRPTIQGRKDIFRVYLSKIVTKEDMDYLTGRLAALTPGFVGADIANAVNEAALVAARANAQSVEMTHFEQAIERVIGGLERKSLVLSPEEKRTVAYHEAGHAICGWYFQHADPLLKVSIIPRGQGALGYAQYLPASDAYLMSLDQLMDRMAMTLGGRVSEELHFDTVTTGASDDFRKVTAMATKMVTEWGMSDMGPIHFNRDENQIQKPFAEATAQSIDAEVRRIVDRAYKQCKDLLIARRTEIGLIAEELLRKEVLTRDDMVRILGSRPFKDNAEFTKFFNNEPPAPSPSPSAPPAPTENPEGPVEGPGPAAPAAFKDLGSR